MPIQVIKDARQAERFMRSELSEGTTLAALVLSRIDFNLGGFRLPMPSIDQSKPLDLRLGNVRLAKDEELNFAGVVRAFIRDPHGALLMQDNEAKVDDPIIGKLPYTELAIGYGEELYWRVAGSQLAELSDAQMLDIINNTSCFPWTGFFYFDGISLAKAALNEADLEHVATNLVGVAVSALHYRSFLIWWRDDLREFPTPA